MRLARPLLGPLLRHLGAACIGVLLLLGQIPSAQAQSARASRPVTLRILAFNDFHGQLNAPVNGVPLPTLAAASGPVPTLPAGGAQHLAGLIAKLRRESPYNVVLAAGDLIGASPLYSAMFHDEPSIEVMSQLGLQFSAVGNHELDHGLAELKRMQQGGCAPDAQNVQRTSCLRGPFKGASFTYLAANIIDGGTGKPVFPAYAIQDIKLPGGRVVRIGFIGAITRSTSRLVRAEAVKGLEFTDEAEAINAQIPELRSRGVDIIAVLIHEGGITQATQFDDDSCPGFSGAIIPIVARLDPAIDVVVSGHTHRVYICRQADKVAGRLVTSAGSLGQFLTVIDVRFDWAHKKVLGTTARQLAVVNDSAPNPAAARYPAAPASKPVQAIVDFYAAAARSAMERKIARLDFRITRQLSPAGESALGDLVADAQLAATAAPAAGGAQLALVNETGIRNDLNPGQTGGGWVTYGDLFAVQPFGNQLVTVSLSGEQLRAALEHPFDAGSFPLQVSSGFSYQVNPAAPEGAKVDIHSLRLNGVPLDPAAVYRVTVNDFLASGGDGITVLTAATGLTKGPMDVEAFERYLASHPVSATPARRISKVEAPEGR